MHGTGRAQRTSRELPESPVFGHGATERVHALHLKFRDIEADILVAAMVILIQLRFVYQNTTYGIRFFLDTQNNSCMTVR